MPHYIPSIGMEVHAELATNSKMFCRCPVAFGGEPNTRTCPICLGLPGTLPVPNRAAVEMVLKTALALNCKINFDSGFQRKNYFYPDLPKGYQISQYQHPLGYEGYLDIPGEGGTKRIKIRRVHLEEDTGKLMHLPNGGSGVDYNRAGVPLMEIVTEFPPDIQDGEEAKEYLVQLRQILLALGVCDGKMEEGSLRCEPNISIRPSGAKELGTKTELKNLNSFRSVQLGVGFEVRRQSAVLDEGGTVLQETRGWNEQREASYLMRAKETENDYRYFSDPDLVPMRFETSVQHADTPLNPPSRGEIPVTPPLREGREGERLLPNFGRQAFPPPGPPSRGEGDSVPFPTIEALRAQLPELPLAKSTRYQKGLGLSAYDAAVLVEDLEWSSYFEEAVGEGGDPKAICNLLTQDFAGLMKEDGQTPRTSKIPPKNLVELTKLVSGGSISSKIGKDVLKEMYRTGRDAGTVIQDKGLTQITDSSAIGEVVAKVLAEHPEVVAKYRSGQVSVKGFLVGQAMKASGGRANPALVQQLMSKALERGE